MLKKALLGVVLFTAAGAFAEDATKTAVNQTAAKAPETTGIIASAKEFYKNNTTLVQAGGVVAVLAVAYAAYRALTAETETDDWNS